jgi:hypothetical protein
MENACSSGAVNAPKKRGRKRLPPIKGQCLQCGADFEVSRRGNRGKKFCDTHCSTAYNMGLKQEAMRASYGACLRCHAALSIPSMQSAARLGVSRKWVLLERGRHGYGATPEGVAARAGLWKGTHKAMLTVEERIKRMLRCQARRIKEPLKRIGKRSLTTNELLGCSYAEARAWIERQFVSGMGWHNTGKWEIDHIVPVAAFDLSNDTHVRRVNHYSNLQPLWREDNRRKADRLPVGQLALL